MDKVLLLSFIEDTYRTFKCYKSLYLFKYFKTINKVFDINFISDFCLIA